MAKQRLTIENNDRASMFSVKDLMEVYHASGIPIVFDYLHHQFCTGGWTEEEAMLTEEKAIIQYLREYNN